MCEYCFENGTKKIENILTKNIGSVISQIENLFNDEWFDQEYEIKNISFWGGEPSLNIELIEKVVNHFIDDRDVTFFIYTNGSRIEKLLPILLNCRDKKSVKDPKFMVQISYDGKYLQDKKRKIKGKKISSSSDIVLEGMKMLHDNHIKFGLKSTIIYEDFKHLENMWDEFSSLYERFGTQLALTVDYHKIKFLENKDEIEKNLLKVADKEIKFNKKYGHFLSNIFASKRMYCGCGKGIATVDVDGQMYYCHGCLYSDQIYSFGSIFDVDLSEKIKRNFNYFKRIEEPNDECAKCPALTCLKCNVKKFEDSKKENFYKRWHDYTSQKDICEYYKMTGRIGRAMFNILREDE
jgi:organic radical activating enzyme